MLSHSDVMVNQSRRCGRNLGSQIPSGTLRGPWDRSQVSNKSVGLWQYHWWLLRDRCEVPNKLVGPVPGLVIGWESEMEISGSYFGILGKYFCSVNTLREGPLLVHPEHTAWLLNTLQKQLNAWRLVERLWKSWCGCCWCYWSGLTNVAWGWL